MAAVTSSGLWPIADPVGLSVLAVTYQPLTPRQAIQMSTLALGTITGSGGYSSSTIVPAVPAFTKYPVTP